MQSIRAFLCCHWDPCCSCVLPRQYILPDSDNESDDGSIVDDDDDNFVDDDDDNENNGSDYDENGRRWK